MKKIITRVIVGVLVGAALIFFPQNSQLVSALSPVQSYSQIDQIQTDSSASAGFYKCNNAGNLIQSSSLPNNNIEFSCDSSLSASQIQYYGGYIGLHDNLVVGEYYQIKFFLWSYNTNAWRGDNGLSQTGWNFAPNTSDTQITVVDYTVNPMNELDIVNYTSTNTFAYNGIQGSQNLPDSNAYKSMMLEFTVLFRAEKSINYVPIGNNAASNWFVVIGAPFSSEMLYVDFNYQNIIDHVKPESFDSAGSSINDQNKQDSQNQSQQQQTQVDDSSSQNTVDDSGVSQTSSSITSWVEIVKNPSAGSCVISFGKLTLPDGKSLADFSNINLCSGPPLPNSLQLIAAGGLAILLIILIFRFTSFIYLAYAVSTGAADSTALIGNIMANQDSVVVSQIKAGK